MKVRWTSMRWDEKSRPQPKPKVKAKDEDDGGGWSGEGAEDHLRAPICSLRQALFVSLQTCNPPNDITRGDQIGTCSRWEMTST